MKMILVAPALLMSVFCCVCASAGSIAFPADAGIHDVKKEFGARGDGRTDDTAAIQAAFRAVSNAAHMSTVYLPNGIYLVSDTLTFYEWVYAQGESRNGVVIKLKDAAPGFQDPAKAKPVIRTLNPGSGQNMNMNFSTHLMHVSVDTGRGNPGAVGIEFMSHNGGGLEDVSIRAGDGWGAIGIDMRRSGQGPALCRRVSVKGFEIGVWTGPSVYTSTFEDVRLSGQRAAGWVVGNHPVTIRHLTSDNSVPAFQSRDLFEGGQIVLVDSTLRGGAEEAVAIDNTQVGKWGHTSLFLRNVTVRGYAAAANDRGRTVSVEEARGEYRNGGKEAEAFPSGGRMLGLEVAETPTLVLEHPSRWRSVMEFDPVELTDATRKPTDTMHGRPMDGHDVTVALQKAIDSGATTVYLPHGTHLVRETIELRGRVRVLQGCGSILAGDSVAMKDKPLIRFGDSRQAVVFIDRLSFVGGGVEHASTRDLVVLHSRWMSYRNARPAHGRLGRLFADDMCGGPWIFNESQDAWLRSLNIEGGYTKVQNHAARLWVLGYKSEGDGSEIYTGARGASEVIGGTCYAGNNPSKPGFIVEDGRFSATITLFWAHEVLLEHTRDGVTKTVKIGKGERRLDLIAANPE